LIKLGDEGLGLGDGKMPKEERVLLDVGTAVISDD
jgi:hypothetical protein